MKYFPLSFLAPVFLLAALPIGCATTDKAPPSPPPPPPADAGRAARPRIERIEGARLATLGKRAGNVQYTEGKRKGQVIAFDAVDAGGGNWKQTENGVRSMVMRSDGGVIVMPREEDFDENVAIEYDPPFVLLPAKVEEGMKVEKTTTMTVYNLKSGSRRDSGPCSYTVELLGMETVDTPAGTFDAYMFRTTRRIALSLATVDVVIHTAHVPDKGIVMTRVEQDTKAVGIFSMKKREESRLAK